MHAIPFKYSRSYLSVSESRRWSLDNPVGDPFGGPAFGEKRMPAVAVGAMIIGAEIGLTTFVGGMMFASGALSFVGQVTGNKTLSMLGAVAGLAAGGAGAFEAMGTAGVESMSGEALAGTTSDSMTQSLASGNVAGMESAGVPSYAMPSYEAATAGAQGALTEAGMIPSAMNNAMTAANTGLSNGSSVLDANFNSILGTNGSPMSLGSAGPVGVDAPVAGVEAAAPGQAAATGSATFPVTPSVEAPTVAGGNTVSPNTPVVDTPKASFADPNYSDGGISPEEAIRGDAAGSPTAKTPGMIDSAMDKLKGLGQFAKENKELLDYGGNILKAYGESDLKDAQLKYMEAKANNDDAQAAYYQAKIAEMNRLAANANARGTNALGSGNAISANGSAYSNNPTRAGNALSFGKA